MEMFTHTHTYFSFYTKVVSIAIYTYYLHRSLWKHWRGLQSLQSHSRRRQRWRHKYPASGPAWGRCWHTQTWNMFTFAISNSLPAALVVRLPSHNCRFQRVIVKTESLCHWQDRFIYIYVRLSASNQWQQYTKHLLEMNISNISPIFPIMSVFNTRYGLNLTHISDRRGTRG